jgi:hypothetical protein
MFRAPSTISNSRSNDLILLTNELNNTFSHLDGIEQLLLLTSLSFGRIPSASFNNRVYLINKILLRKKTYL